MALNIRAELKRLGTLKTPQLKARYAELFGEPTRCNNRPYLIKRIAWRLQADAEGDLSERARQRAAEILVGQDPGQRLIFIGEQNRRHPFVRHAAGRRLHPDERAVEVEAHDPPPLVEVDVEDNRRSIEVDVRDDRLHTGAAACG